MLRTAFAFVLSAWPAALIESVLIAISPSAHQGVFAHPLSTFVAMCLIFYLFEIFLGIPAVILLRRKKLAACAPMRSPAWA
jgi:uncharacterized membrane protein